MKPSMVNLCFEPEQLRVAQFRVWHPWASVVTPRDFCKPAFWNGPQVTIPKNYLTNILLESYLIDLKCLLFMCFISFSLFGWKQLYVLPCCRSANLSMSGNWPFLSEQNSPVQSPLPAVPHVSWHKRWTYCVSKPSCSIFLNVSCAHYQSTCSLSSSYYYRWFGAVWSLCPPWY